MKTVRRILLGAVAAMGLFVVFFPIQYPNYDESDYAYIEEGMVMKFGITLNRTAQQYNEVIIKAADSSRESFMTIIDRGSVWYTEEKPLKGVLELKVCKPDSLPDGYAEQKQFLYYYSYEIKIVQDTLGLYHNVNHLYWLKFDGGSSLYEVCQYDKQYIGEIKCAQGYQIGLEESAFSTRPLFVCSYAKDYQPDTLSANWQYMNNRGYDKQPEFPKTSLIKMERQVKDEYYYENWFTEETWFSKEKGLVKLVQTTIWEATSDEKWAGGGTTMVWDRIF